MEGEKYVSSKTKFDKKNFVVPLVVLDLMFCSTSSSLRFNM